MKKWKIILLSVTLVLLTLLVCAPFLLQIGVEKYALRDFSREEKNRYYSWTSDKLRFAPKDLEALPWRDETVAASKAFNKTWKVHESAVIDLDKKYEEFLKLPKGTTRTLAWKAIEKEFPPLRPVSDAFETMVAQPDYEIIAFLSGWSSGINSGPLTPNYLHIQNSLNLLNLESIALTLRSDHAGALQKSEIIVRASKTHKFSSTISLLMGIDIQNVGTQSWRDTVASCNDGKLLRRTLKTQNALMPSLPRIPKGMHLRLLDNIGGIREASRLGIKVHVQDRTGREILSEYLRIWDDCLERFFLPAIKEPYARAITEGMIEEYRADYSTDRYSGLTGKLHTWWILNITLPIKQNVSYPNSDYTESFTLNHSALAKFDLLRLETARKLYALDHEGRAPKKTEDFVPDYLPEVPRDIFSKKDAPYGWAKGGYYSVGPDGVDEKGAVTYDPMNFTVSGGDIFLRARPAPPKP